MNREALEELAGQWREDAEDLPGGVHSAVVARLTEAHARELEYVLEHGELPGDD